MPSISDVIAEYMTQQANADAANDALNEARAAIEPLVAQIDAAAEGKSGVFSIDADTVLIVKSGIWSIDTLKPLPS